jgi:hypothetical protein
MPSRELSERVAAANVASTAKLQSPGERHPGILARIQECRAQYQRSPAGRDAREWMRDADRLLGEIEATLSAGAAANQE